MHADRQQQRNQTISQLNTNTKIWYLMDNADTQSETIRVLKHLKLIVFGDRCTVALILLCWDNHSTQSNHGVCTMLKYLDSAIILDMSVSCKSRFNNYVLRNTYTIIYKQWLKHTAGHPRLTTPYTLMIELLSLLVNTRKMGAGMCYFKAVHSNIKRKSQRITALEEHVLNTRYWTAHIGHYNGR